MLERVAKGEVFHLAELVFRNAFDQEGNTCSWRDDLHEAHISPGATPSTERDVLRGPAGAWMNELPLAE